MLYRISEHASSISTVFLPKQFLSGNNFDNFINKITYLSFGQLRSECKFIINEELADDEISISSNLTKYLFVDCELNYQVAFTDNTLRIGPIIGLMVKGKIIESSKTTLKTHLKNIIKSSKIGGVICAFSWQSINFETKTIEGFYYNPNSDKWVMVILPIPDAVYRRTAMPWSLFNKLSVLTGRKVFNSYFFNKWEFWQVGLQAQSIKNNIPYTEKITSADKIAELLDKYGLLYLKPVNGTFSRGIIRLEKTDSIFIAKTNTDIKPLLLSTKEDLKTYITKLVFTKNYLAQQGVEVIKLTDAFTSFRVIMQKNKHLKWQCTGIISRIGEARGISSNFNSWGYGLTFEEFFKRSLNLNDSQISEKRQEVVDICNSVCEAIENAWGNYGDVGIDIGIDKNLKIWVFEVNKTHMHYIPLKINDYRMYNQVKLLPIEYSVALSGFKVNEA